MIIREIFKDFFWGNLKSMYSVDNRQRLYGKNFSNGAEGFENISLQSLFRKSRVSHKQKEVANNYMVIKKIFGFSAVNSRITNSETSLLRQYGLIEWSKTGDILKKTHSDTIFEIRVKELKFLQANNSLIRLGELYDGYNVLEKYIEYIAG